MILPLAKMRINPSTDMATIMEKQSTIARSALCRLMWRTATPAPSGMAEAISVKPAIFIRPGISSLMLGERFSTVYPSSSHPVLVFQTNSSSGEIIFCLIGRRHVDSVDCQRRSIRLVGPEFGFDSWFTLLLNLAAQIVEGTCLAFSRRSADSAFRIPDSALTSPAPTSKSPRTRPSAPVER